MEEENINKKLEARARAEEDRCISALSELVQNKIVPVDPVFVISKLQTVDKAIVWYIEKIEAENALLRKIKLQ